MMDELMPHAMCLLSDPSLILVLAIGNVVTGMAYLVIPLSLRWMIAKQSDTSRSRTRLIQLFVAACGSVHFMMAITLFKGGWTYYVLAFLVAVMAFVSTLTAAAFWRARRWFVPE